MRIAVIAWKEFLQLWRDWRTLAVVIALPVVMLVLYGYAINFDLKGVSLAVRDLDGSPASREVAGSFVRSGYFRVVARPVDWAAVDEVLDRGRAKAVLEIPRGFARDIAAGRAASLQLLVDGSDSTTATTAIGYAEAVIAAYSRTVIVESVRRRGLADVENLVPLEARPRFWYNPDQKSTNFIVPGLTAVILMMMSTLLTAMTVVREKERGTMEQLIASPISGYELMIGKLLPYVVIAFFDLLLVLGAGRVLFGVGVRGSIALLLGLSLVFLLSALGTGLLISVVSPSQQTAMTVAMMASQLPSVLLSGFVFPVSAMPVPLQWLTNIVPARHYLVIVRSIVLKGTGMTWLWRPTFILLAFGVVSIALCARRFRERP